MATTPPLPSGYSFADDNDTDTPPLPTGYSFADASAAAPVSAATPQPASSDIDMSKVAGANGPLPQPAAHPAVDMGPTLSPELEQQVNQSVRNQALNTSKPATDAVNEVVSGAKDIGKSAAMDFKNSGGNPLAPNLTGDAAKQRNALALGGAAKVISGAGTAAFMADGGKVLETGIKAATGNTLAKVEMAKLAASIGIGFGASAGAGVVADKVQVSPQAKSLIQALAFFVPSLAGLAGIHADVVDTDQGKGVAGTIFAKTDPITGKPVGGVQVVAGVSPEGVVGAGVKVGSGPMRTVRYGNTAPPDPATVEATNLLNQGIQTMKESAQADAAAQAIVKGATPEQAVAAQQPKAPPTPSDQAAAQMFPTPVIQQDHMTAAAQIIKALPPEQQGAATLQAHDQLTAQIGKWTSFVGPDGKTYTNNSDKDPAKFASQFINAEVDKHDAAISAAQQPTKEQQSAANPTQAASSPAVAPAKGKSSLQAGVEDRQTQRAKTIIETSNSPQQAVADLTTRLRVSPEQARNLIAQHQQNLVATQAPTIGSSTEPVVEESRKTIDAQMDALKQGTIKVVMLPEGSKYRPALPEGMKVMEVKGQAPGAGRYIYDPSQVRAGTIREAAKNGTHGDLLGHIQTKEDIAAAPSTVGVVAHRPDGTEIQASAVDASKPQLVQAQAQILAERHPDAQISVKAPEQVLADRLATQDPPLPAGYEFADQAKEVSQPTNEKGGTEVASKTEPEAAGSQRGVAPAATIHGKKTTVLTPNGKHEGKYRLMEADSLIPSHDAHSFAKNPKYPEGVQERDYEKSKEAQGRVIAQSQAYDPAYTINSNPDAVNGPPIVTPEGIVLGGNSRAMSTQRAYGSVYRDKLRSEAGDYGLTPEQVDGMKKPVLVREIAAPSSPDEMRRVGSDLNKSMTGALGVSEKAVSAGKSITPSTLDAVSRILVNAGTNGEPATLRQAMSDQNDASKILQMMVNDKVITERERPQFIDTATGGLSEEGKTFFERALLGSVVDDSQLMDATPKSILNKIDGSLGALATISARKDDYNLLPVVREALEQHAEIAARGTSIELFQGQAGMFDDIRNPVIDAMARTLAGKPAAVRKAFNGFAQDAKADVEGQGSLLSQVPGAFDSFNHWFGTTLTEQEYRDGIARSLEEEQPAGAKAGSLEDDRDLPAERSKGPQAKGSRDDDRRAGRQELDRRSDTSRRKSVGEMTPEEMRRELLTSRTVDLPNRRAFDEAEHAEPAKAVGMSDADGLKALNDKFGYEAGDQLLRAKAEALKEAGLDAYHDKGDEFLYRGDSAKDIDTKLGKARDILRDRIIQVTTPQGEVLKFKGADFSFGTGDRLNDAEGRLKEHKSERESSGERARGELRGIAEVRPEGRKEDGSPAKEVGPKKFVAAPSGSLDYGEITPQISKSIGVPAGSIRLREGDTHYGLKHIEMRHGEGIRKRGYPSVEAFVEHVAKNFDAIYGRARGSLDVVLSEGEHGRMIVHLEPDASGDFYDVKTATPSRDNQYKNKSPLWERTGTSTPLAEASPLFPGAKAVDGSVEEPEHKYKFGNVQHNIDDGSPAAKALYAARSKVDDADLAGDGKDVGENHVTVRYGLHKAASENLKSFIRAQAPFEAKLGKVAAFPPHGDAKEQESAPLIAGVESPELHKINGEIDKHDNFEPSSFPDYKPHATIAYVKPDAVKKYVGDKSTEGKTFMVRSIAVGDRDGNHEEVKLEGKPTAIKKGGSVRFKGIDGKERIGTIADNTNGLVTRIKGDDGKPYNVPKKNVLGPVEAATEKVNTEKESDAQRADSFLAAYDQERYDAAIRNLSGDTIPTFDQLRDEYAKALREGVSNEDLGTTKDFARSMAMGTGRFRNSGTTYLNGGLGFAAGALKPIAQIKPVADTLAFIGDEADRVATSRDLHNGLYDLNSQYSADVLRAVQLMKSLPGTARDEEVIYHHLEDPKIALTPTQEEILDDHLTPMVYEAERIYQKLSDGGMPVENYVHRVVREKGSLIDRIRDGSKGNGSGKSLSKATGSQKHRAMMAIETPEGKRKVVAIKGGRVSVVTKGNPPKDIGALAKGLTTVGKEVEERAAPFVKQVTDLRDEIANAPAEDHKEQLASVQEKIAKLKDKLDLLATVKVRTGMSKPDMFDKGGKAQYTTEPTFNQRAAITRELDPLLKLEESIKSGKAPMLAKNVMKLYRRKESLKDAEAARDHFMNELPAESFVDKAWKSADGQMYKITQATTKEIEASTDLKYYHNAAASVITNYLAMRKAERAHDFIESFKSSPEFADVAHSLKSPGKIPDGWKTTQLPQFHGYFFEPHIAEVLDMYAKKLTSTPGILEKVGDFLRTSIFFNPLIHIPNLLNHWVVEKGVSGFANPMNYPTITRAGVKAINAVIHQNADFLEALDHGAPLQSQQFETKQFADLFFKKMQDEIGDPENSKAIEMAKALGMSPVNLVKAIYKFSGKATWYTNDIAFLQAAYEKQEKGMSLKDALTETGKHIPDYRLMTRIFDSSKLGALMSNKAVTMFGAYHYGALKSYGQIIKSVAGLNWHDAGTKNEQGESTNSAGRTEGEEKLHGLDILAMAALMVAVVYPLIDHLWKAFTHNDKAQMRRAGSSTLIYNLAMLAKGEKTPEEVEESIATPAVPLKTAAELAFNRDLRTGQRIYDPHVPLGRLGMQVGRRLAASVAPVDQGLQVAEGRTDWKKLMYSMVGVSFPLHGAEKIAAQINAERLASLPPRDEKDVIHSVKRSRALHDAWAGDRKALNELLDSDDYTPKEKMRMRRDALLPPLVVAVRNMGYDNTALVYKASTPEQRDTLRPILNIKMDRLIKGGKKPLYETEELTEK
jgi:GGDEF domain-containing protein/2'-5' RNA ligase